MHVLISGGTGFVGTPLIAALCNEFYQVTIYTRDPRKVVSGVKAIDNLDAIASNSSIDAIINLAGAPISKRWNASYKQELVNSRVNTTQALVKLVERLDTKPSVFISASAIGYYGSHEDQKLDENSKPHDEFTHQLCKAWEEATNAVKEYGVRTCIFRLGVVLGNGGGALKEMLPAFKLGLGGKIGSGEQYFSWVQRQDVVKAMLIALEQEEYEGVYNLTAPNPVTNSDFAKTLGHVLNRPALLPMPSYAVKILFGHMGKTLLLKGQRVIPKRLLTQGFTFDYPDLQGALEQSLLVSPE